MWRSMYSDMSKRTSSTPSVAASCFATSVLPTPVGPENRKQPIGFSGSPSPARAILIGGRQRLDRLVLAEHHALQVALEMLAAPRRRPCDTLFGGIRAMRRDRCSRSP